MALMRTRGVNRKPLFVTIYGTDHTGKSTVASNFPKPIFIDVEKGTDLLDVDRCQPDTYDDVLNILNSLYTDAEGFKTVVIDTIDWVEKMADSAICKKKDVSSLTDMGWGTGIKLQKDYMYTVIDKLCAIRQSQGLNIVILGHAKQRRYDDPEQEHSYDRFHMAINSDIFDKIRERSDAVFFVCKDIRVVVDPKNPMKKAKGVSTGKVMCHTEESAGFFAKNRFELPSFFEFSFSNIKNGIDNFYADNIKTATPSIKKDEENKDA